ncbi:MAG: HEAT repeat domain-containing protein [Oscillatoriales cyanobacterium RM2_1_1]|nr:HEAT repeat domain-containing protein [Oscillatoriales cyanobacterium SM2_3_0]NJO47848.1 HEAT repeat domain-containing protein [Oscillatoriales cyanobacterium RM2_1_1]
MDRRFFNLFNLTEAQAIQLLKTPLDQLDDPSERYVAAAQLAYFSTESSVKALIEATEIPGSELYHRIARRKAIESLGKLKAPQALRAIRACLSDQDCYTVENAVWAIGEIGSQDQDILAEITALLHKPDQSYRVIIQTLSKLNYYPSLKSIEQFVEAENQNLASVAIATIARLSGDYTQIGRVVELLQHSNVEVRRSCIQDLIDADYFFAIPEIATCPVSLVFRLRGIRLLASSGKQAGQITFADVEPYLDQVIWDHPNNLKLVHEYDQAPEFDFLLQELYQTDFGRCYLGSKTLLELYPDQAASGLLATYAAQAHNDYGAHYHVIKLLGWLKYAPAYDLLVEALNNTAPQFQKSRVAAAIALGQLGNPAAIPLLQQALEQKSFELKYAALIALEQLEDLTGKALLAKDPDWLIQAKANR